VVAEGNGEAAYLTLVKQHLTAESKVLEVACGHGDVALEIAGSCKHVVAYDRVASYIDLASPVSPYSAGRVSLL